MASIDDLALTAVQETGTARDADSSSRAVDRKAQRYAVSQIHAKADFAVGDGRDGHVILDIDQLILLVESQFPEPASVVRSRLFDRARHHDFLCMQQRSGDEIRNDHGTKSCPHNPSLF